MKGGYVIANFRNVSIVKTNKTIDGVYESVSEACKIGKPILATNLNIYGEHHAPMFITVLDGAVNKVAVVVGNDGKSIYRININQNGTVNCETYTFTPVE